MSVKVINGQAIPNMPWQDKPADCNEVIWRDNRNPIIPRNLLPTSNSIFNSAVVPFEGKFAGVFRVDDKERNMALHAGFSEDGIHWNINPTRIMFEQAEKSTEEVNQWGYGYDPRVCFIEDRYWVTWCNAYGWKPTIGVGYTYDFKTFYQCENAFLPFNRNGVLFPRKIDGKYVMFSRPSDSGHTPFGDMCISQSPDMKYWGEHRHVMGPLKGWESKKIGAGPIQKRQTRAGSASITVFLSLATALYTASQLASLTRSSHGKLSTDAASISSTQERSMSA